MVRKRPSRSTSARPIGRHVEQRLQVRRLAAAALPIAACRTAGRCRRPLPRGSTGTCTARSGAARLALGDQPHLVVFADLDEVGEPRLPDMFGPERSARSANRRLAARACPSRRPPRPGRQRRPAARRSVRRSRLTRTASGSRRRRSWETPQQQVAVRADPLDLDRRGPGWSSTPATQPAPSRQAMV